MQSQTMKNQMMRIFMPVMAVALSSCAAGQVGSVMLHEWPEGSVTEYEITRGEVQSTDIPGRGVTSTEVSAVMTVAVEQTGSRQFGLTFTEAKTTSATLDISTLIGLECRVTLDERGLITGITGISDNPYIEARGGEDLFREDLQLLFLYLPEDELKQDVEWLREHSLLAEQGALKVNRNFTDTFLFVDETALEGVPAVNVDLNSATVFSGVGEMSGTAVELMLQGDVDSSIHVDPVTGQLLHLKGEHLHALVY